MATTTGLIQRLFIGEAFTCAFIGASPANTEVLIVSNRDQNTPTDFAFRTTVVGALAQALIAKRQVSATHGDNSAEITSLNLLSAP